MENVTNITNMDGPKWWVGGDIRNFNEYMDSQFEKAKNEERDVILIEIDKFISHSGYMISACCKENIDSSGWASRKLGFEELVENIREGRHRKRIS